MQTYGIYDKTLFDKNTAPKQVFFITRRIV